jgi:hypothetical protein
MKDSPVDDWEMNQGHHPADMAWAKVLGERDAVITRLRAALLTQADEIERLRAALECIAEWEPMLRGDDWHMRATARAALTGRDTPT